MNFIIVHKVYAFLSLPNGAFVFVTTTWKKDSFIIISKMMYDCMYIRAFGRTRTNDYHDNSNYVLGPNIFQYMTIDQDDLSNRAA